jgi:hypothetical protein
MGLWRLENLLGAEPRAFGHLGKAGSGSGGKLMMQGGAIKILKFFTAKPQMTSKVTQKASDKEDL